MAAMDSQYVSGNAYHAPFLGHLRKNTDSTECDKFCFWNSGYSDDALETE